MRWSERILVIGVAVAGALLACACEQGRPGREYSCTCQLTCDGQTSPWSSVTCSPQDASPAEVEEKASENCRDVHQAECTQVSCTCSNCGALPGDGEC